MTLWIATAILPGCAEPDTLAAPVAETCADRPEVVETLQRDFPPGELNDVRLGACGELTWRDSMGVSHVGPDFASVRQLAEDAQSVTLSAAGDQMLSARQDGMAQWRSTDAPEQTVTFEAERYGFVRDGSQSLAWFCAQQTLGTVGPEGTVNRASVGDCQVWPADAAPVLAYIDPDFELAVIDLRGGDVKSLSEVPFVAAGDDLVRLSRDGRMLFHQPRNSPVPRLAVFDLRRAQGDRLLGAPETNRGIGGMVQAPRAGHTAMFQGQDGFFVVTPNGFLNAYTNMVFLSLSPDGDEVAMVSGSIGAQARYDVLVSDLDSATVAELASAQPAGVAVLPNYLRASWDGNAVVAEGRNPAFGLRSTRMSFRWDTREFAEVEIPTGDSRAMWVSETGSVLVRDNNGAATLGRVGQPALHRWETAGFNVAGSLPGDRLLLRLSTGDGSERVILASTVGAASRDLGTFTGLRTLMVDHDATRLVTVANEPDPAMPAGFVSRFVARAMPTLP